MHIEYTQSENNKIAFYVFEDSALDKEMGTGEGTLGLDSDLYTVIKVYNGYMNQGLG